MHEVTMPKLSDSMEVGKIIAWKVAEGDSVAEGDVLAEVESDKAVMDLECFEGGVVSKIIHTDGEEVAVGDPIALVAEVSERSAEASVVAKAAPEMEKEAAPEPEPEAKTPPRPAHVLAV